MLGLSLRQLINVKISPIMVVFLILGKGADPNRPLCRKAKDIRKEKRLQKEQLKQQETVSYSPSPAPSKSSSNQPKSLEEFITEYLPNDPLHRLEVSHELCLYVILLWGQVTKLAKAGEDAPIKMDPAPISKLQLSHTVVSQYPGEIFQAILFTNNPLLLLLWLLGWSQHG